MTLAELKELTPVELEYIIAHIYINWLKKRLRQILQIMKISIKNQNAAHIVKLNPLLNMVLIKENKILL